MIEILSKEAVLYTLLQILIGGGDNADIRLDRLMTTHAIEEAVAQNAQKPGLQFHRHVADFIEKERAAPRLLKTTKALCGSPRECSLFMAEKLALQQITRDGRHIDGDVGLRRPLAVAPDGPGHDLLARPGLTCQKHRHKAVGKTPDRAKDLLHRRRLTDEVGNGLRLRLFRCRLLRLRFYGWRHVLSLLHGALDELDRLRDVEGLCQILEGPALKGRDGALKIRIGRHDDDGEVRHSGLDMSQQIHPRHSRHADVAHEHHGRRVFKRLQYGLRLLEKPAFDARLGKRP